MVRNREDARDLTQAVFLKAYRGLSTYDSRRRFYSWIYRIMLNECLDFLRAHRKLEPLDEGRAASTPTPEERMQANETGELVQDALMTLSVPSRQVIVLRHFLQLSYGEMSEVLTIPEKTIKSRLFTARRQIAEALRRKGVTTA
jgi:RNA polymerase sigma-70 factor (ECF subfamily)